MSSQPERRRYLRIKLLQQVRGRVGPTRVVLDEASTQGMSVLHRDSLGKPGSPCTISFDWEGDPVVAECTLVYTTVRKEAKSALEQTLYESGLEIERIDGARTLKAMIEWHVLRALDEQKANARGIPTIAAQSFQTGKGELLVRHEFVNGVWREIRTTDSRQPANGFTVSAEETDENIQMLRKTYAEGDEMTREMIRQTSAMSVSQNEGIPTRRYEP